MRTASQLHEGGAALLLLAVEERVQEVRLRMQLDVRWLLLLLQWVVRGVLLLIVFHGLDQDEAWGDEVL